MDVLKTEDDQIDQFKQWWSKNGKQLMAGIVVAAALATGIRLWTNYQEGRRMAAAVLYDQALQALEKKDNTTVMQQATAVIEQYSGTTYAALSGLIAARLEWEKGEKDAARARLQWVIDHSNNVELRHVARLRLARFWMADNKLDEAMKLVDQKDAGAFAAAYQFIKGDILLQQGKTLEAQTAFYAVIADKTAVGELHNQAQQRLDDLGAPPPPKLEAKS
ncbi:MAG: tetratricopeptide repeat protein [Gammaproteobacteria bacterium]|nr:tetratricopeptide repeat protein [Gammaproteobacteria bacterium]